MPFRGTRHLDHDPKREPPGRPSLEKSWTNCMGEPKSTDPAGTGSGAAPARPAPNQFDAGAAL
jgi:hypothetical protein